MQTDLQDEQSKIIAQLELLNAKIDKQNSIRHVFGMAIIYGIGFFVGSAIIATIAFGILSPWIGQIDWVRDNFERGSMMGRSY